VGDGVADDTAAIQAAIAAIGSDERTLYFPPGTYYIGTTGLTFPDNVTVKFGRGATLADNGDPSIDVVVGSVDAGPYQIFDFTGAGSTVKFSSVGSKTADVLVSWFGSDATGFQNAINSGAISVILDSNITTSTTISLVQGQNIRGRLKRSDQTGTLGVEILYTGTGTCLDMATGGSASTSDLRLSDIRVAGTGNANANLTGISAKDVRRSRFDNIEVVDFGTAGSVGFQLDADFGFCGINTFTKCRFEDCTVGMTMLTSGTAGCNVNSFYHCSWVRNGIGCWLQIGRANYFTGCNFQNQTTCGLRIEDHDTKLVANYWEKNGNADVDLVAAGSLISGSGGYNTHIVGDYHALGSTSIEEVANPDGWSIQRWVGGKNFVMDDQWRGDEDGTTYMRIIPSTGANPHDFILYDEDNSDYVVFYDHSEDHVRSDKGWMKPWNVLEFTSNGSLTNIQSGSLVTNRGAAGAVEIGLPEPAIGTYFHITRTTNQTLRIQPASGDRIRGGGVDKYLEIVTQGGSVVLGCAQSNVMEILSSSGTYTFEA
jgi:hypothetical protein